MRPVLVFSGLLLALLLAAVATDTHAQDIVGLSMRATDAMPGGGRGSVDIVKSQGASNYLVSVDLAAAAEGMDLTEFEGAKAWVAWAVDMDGIRHNLGALNADSAIKDVPVDYMVARVYVTAEPDAAAKAPTGDPLFSVTLRNVKEVDTLPADSQAAAAQPAASATTAAATGAGAAAAATSVPAAQAPSAAAAKDGAKPKELPTTGTWVQDVLAALLVATALLAGGWRLRSVRV